MPYSKFTSLTIYNTMPFLSTHTHIYIYICIIHPHTPNAKSAWPSANAHYPPPSNPWHHYPETKPSLPSPLPILACNSDCTVRCARRCNSSRTRRRIPFWPFVRRGWSAFPEWQRKLPDGAGRICRRKKYTHTCVMHDRESADTLSHRGV